MAIEGLVHYFKMVKLEKTDQSNDKEILSVPRPCFLDSVRDDSPAD